MTTFIKINDFYFLPFNNIFRNDIFNWNNSKVSYLIKKRPLRPEQETNMALSIGAINPKRRYDVPHVLCLFLNERRANLTVSISLLPTV